MDKVEFKKTLEEAIEILATVKRLEKTPSVDFIASALHTKRRQVFRWLDKEEDVFPHDLETKYRALQEIIEQCRGETPNSNRQPVPAILSGISAYPFQMTISRDSLKLKFDEGGNIVIDGLFSVKLK